MCYVTYNWCGKFYTFIIYDMMCVIIQNLTVPTKINVSDTTNLILNDESQDCIRQLMDGFANSMKLL